MARSSDYAISRINFSTCDGVLPQLARFLWYRDAEMEIITLTALHELTKYPQSIIQIHADAVVRRLLGYLKENDVPRGLKSREDLEEPALLGCG